MNKINYITAALILLSPLANAYYVSPTVYKGFTCDELKTDLNGHQENSLSKSMEAMDLDIDIFKAEKLSEQLALAALKKDEEMSESHIKTIKLVAKKLKCDNFKK